MRTPPDISPGIQYGLLQFVRLFPQRLVVVLVGVSLDEVNGFLGFDACGNCQHGRGSAVVEGCLRVSPQELPHTDLLRRDLL